MRESNPKVSAENQRKVSFGNQNESRIATPKVSSERTAVKPFQRQASVPKPPQPVASTIPPRTVPAIASATPPPNLKISSRDLQVLEFILDMKFASREELFERFYSRTRENEPAKSNLYALERLALLERHGFLKGVQSFSETTKYFIATEKAYITLNQKLEMDKLPKPVGSIDQRIFLHDKLVLKARVEFERAFPEGKWFSDRRLRSGMAAMFGLPSAMIPDAIYEFPTGERVAFELENAPKGKSAYQEKIEFFVKLMRMRKDDPHMFTRIRYRCVYKEVAAKLTEMTSMYGPMFAVEYWRPEGLDLPERAR
jgi:hypothetical protein